MSDEYLWNREGERDPEVARLEGLLRPLAYRPVTPKPALAHSSWKIAIPFAIAASFAVLGLFWLAKPPAESETGWTVTMDGGTSRAVRQGETLATSTTAGASISSSFVGELTLEPNSRLRLLESREQKQRFNLQRGVMHALVWAPPAQFVVDTPSARTVDLGCSYTLEVSDDGAGRLSVQHGWVAFQAGARESFIPAGAACRTTPVRGPGTPYFEDADPKLVASLQRFDDSNDSLGEVLAASRAKDALTLWHLLSRTKGADRDRVYTRLAGFVKLPPVASEAAIQKGDRAALDAAWDSLELGDTGWWRTWKRAW